MPAETILVVDDEAAMRELLGEILSQAGFRVFAASNGREALVALEEVRPQLILSDIKMPGMDGYQLYEQVRSRPEWVLVPFVFLTSLGEEADVRQARGLGVDDYIVKPFREGDLLLAVRARLARHAQLEAAREAQVEELKRTILRTLNHELRTPLTYLSGYAEILRESGAELGGGPLKQAIDGILAGSDRLCRLVEDLIMLVDLDSTGARQAHERRRRRLDDLPSLLKAVLEGERARAEAHGVRLVADVPPELPPVLGDPEALAGALRRLLDNAVKFSRKEGGEANLRARAEGRRLLIRVRDQGVGMPASELGRISDLFYQFDRGTQEQQGSGLGLTIVRGIVALHGGVLRFESEVGIGFTATIELPTAS